ncbi:ribonuclease domain-containing protein [Arthrobacter sp. 92]|uniref:ribonuclease domain-containing protein n=1 Tax=Arthrobacter sp. 92 TaxID=3418175 RepID=UPI003D053ECF
MRAFARLLVFAVAILCLAGLGLLATSPPQLAGSPGANAPTSSAATAGGTSAASPAPAPRLTPGVSRTNAVNASGLKAVNASSLPAEARRTLELIAQGGPYPYSRDAVLFSNFEGLLPRKPNGYYQEFTVETSGESDRGPRRIITGGAGEKYYTPDHYQSFVFVNEAK